MKKMSTSKKQKENKKESKNESAKDFSDDDSDVIDLCDDHDYQVLSAIFETEKGKNVAEILNKIQKDLHLLATSVNQLIQLSLAAQQSTDSDDSEEEEDEEEEQEKDGDEDEDE
jgi:ribosomal protein L12E/L44/L45/RPP1/RPP2